MFVQEAAASSGGKKRGGREARRGYARQRGRREAERRARRDAVEYVRFALLHGGTKKSAARELGIPMRTLSEWERREREKGLEARRRGRRPERSSREDRNRVIAAVNLLGPKVGVRTLRWFYPEMARSELEEILRRSRKLYMRENKLLVHELSWREPGAVWAMDHSDSPQPIGGDRQVAFSVRDLASGAQLLWESAHGPTAPLTVEAMRRLLELHGAPLVVKSDNGSAFRSREMAALLERWGAKLLLSPPRTPRYNGACESGIRWLKERTEHLAARHGHAAAWEAEDMERAKELQNMLPKDASQGERPRGEVFEARRRITEKERSAFAIRVKTEELLAREERGIARDVVLSWRKQSEINRTAIRRALVAHGILSIRRRRVSLTLKSLFRAKIA
jgi:putative transposase